MKEVKLKIEKEFLEDHQVKLVVEIDSEPLEKAKIKAARTLSRNIKIPGFRPGKAPYNVVERNVGEGAILENALDILIGDLYPKIIEESNISPYGPGTLENVPTLEPPTFEFIVPLDAEVELGDFHQIRIPYELDEITEKDIERVIDDLRNRQAILEPVDRPAEQGDQVFIRIEGKKLDIDESESDELVKERPMPVVIEAEDADTTDEWPFSGFSRELIGHTAEDNFKITHSFPEDTPYESLRGSKAEFSITVEDIKSRIIPDVDDEFAQSIGDFENLQELQETIRNNLEEQAKSDYDADYNEEIIDRIIDTSSIKYPPQMIEQEVEIYLEQLKNRLAQQGLDLDVYLKSRQMNLEELKEEIQPQAENRLKRNLVLFEVSRAEDIQVEEDEVQSQTEALMDEFNRTLSPEEARKTLTPDFVRSWVGNVTADLIIQNTLEHLQDIAQGNISETSDRVEEDSEEDSIPTQDLNEESEDINNVENVDPQEKNQTNSEPSE